MFFTLLFINGEEINNINKEEINNMRTRKILRARTLQGDLIMEDINHFTEDKYNYIFIIQINKINKKMIFPKKLYRLERINNFIDVEIRG
jgi:hypothetical protein